MIAFLNAHAPLFYGIEVAISLVLTAISGRVALIKTTLILLAAWIGCNVIEAANGYDDAPLLIPLMDAILCMATLMVAVPSRNWPAIAVATGYGAAIAIWCAALYTRTQSTLVCYLATNGVFFVQCLIGGGAGGLAYLDARRHRRNLFASARPSGA
jgi:hypothetical protein